MTFEAAPLDRTARIVSTFTVVLLLGVAVAMGAALPSSLAVGMGVLYLGILGIAWAMAPSGYRLEGDRLTVLRHAWRPLEARVRGLSDMPEPGRMGLRVGGSGGGFGYWGRFRRKDVGGYRAYLTSREPGHVLALDTDLGVVTLSPADLDGFRARVEAVT